jgi:hypothetical protein
MSESTFPILKEGQPIVVAYGEALIRYLEGRGTWEVNLDKTCVARGNTLSEARAAYDRFCKKESKQEFDRHSALCEETWGNKAPQRVTVTSYTDDGEVWTVSEDKSRSRRRMGELKEYSPENLAIVQEMTVLNEKIEVLAKALKDRRSSLAPYKRRIDKAAK